MRSVARRANVPQDYRGSGNLPGLDSMVDVQGDDESSARNQVDVAVRHVTLPELFRLKPIGAGQISMQYGLHLSYSLPALWPRSSTLELADAHRAEGVRWDEWARSLDDRAQNADPNSLVRQEGV